MILADILAVDIPILWEARGEQRLCLEKVGIHPTYIIKEPNEASAIRKRVLVCGVELTIDRFGNFPYDIGAVVLQPPRLGGYGFKFGGSVNLCRLLH